MPVGYNTQFVTIKVIINQEKKICILKINNPSPGLAVKAM